MLQTDTTVQTRVSRSDRFGGYRSMTSTPVQETDFVPFQFSGEQTTLVPTTEFETEKQYTVDSSEVAQVQETRKMDMPTLEKVDYERPEIVASSRPQIVAASRPQIVAKAKLNARGKIAVAVYSIIFAILAVFCIVKAVQINGLEDQIAVKTQAVAMQEQVINQLQTQYNELGEEINVANRVNGLDDNFVNVNSSNTIYVDGFVKQERVKESAPTNWFEEFCQALAQLFS